MLQTTKYPLFCKMTKGTENIFIHHTEPYRERHDIKLDHHLAKATMITLQSPCASARFQKPHSEGHAIAAVTHVCKFTQPDTFVILCFGASYRYPVHSVGQTNNLPPRLSNQHSSSAAFC